MHKVSFWGVRCWYEPKTNTLTGVNWFHDILIPVACWFQDTMAMITQWFNPAWENPGWRLKKIKIKPRPKVKIMDRRGRWQSR